MNLDKMRIAELEQENKRLSLQVEVLSAAFANSSEKEKDLMAEKSEMLDFLEDLAFPKRGSDAETWTVEARVGNKAAAIVARVKGENEF